MKAVILAGGYGTRISEESALKPKPMVEIGDYPILWHIMKSYSHFGINEFVICCGYKGYVIKEYFSNYFLHHSDVTFDFSKENSLVVHNHVAEPWCVTLIDTGLNTMTGGRIKRIKPYVEGERFMLTYGDGVSDIDIKALLQSHAQSNAKLTLTAIQLEGRFGALDIESNGRINSFIEKPKGDGAWINGGYMVAEPEVFDYLDDDSTIFEQEPLRNLAAHGKLNAYKHYGFWMPMDTLRDKQKLDSLWTQGKAPWKKW